MLVQKRKLHVDKKEDPMGAQQASEGRGQSTSFFTMSPTLSDFFAFMPKSQVDN